MLIESASIYQATILIKSAGSRQIYSLLNYLAWRIIRAKSHKSEMDMSGEKTDYADRIGRYLKCQHSYQVDQ